MSRMNLYCTGGAGTNIGRYFLKYAQNKDPGFAELLTYFVDTSRSNLHHDIPEDRIYLVDGLDGSGKRRDANYESLSERSKEILHKFKPAEINVVLHSAAGGRFCPIC